MYKLFCFMYTKKYSHLKYFYKETFKKYISIKILNAEKSILLKSNRA